MQPRCIGIRQDKLILIPAADIYLLLPKCQISIQIRPFNNRQRYRLIVFGQIQWRSIRKGWPLQHNRMRRFGTGSRWLLIRKPGFQRIGSLCPPLIRMAANRKPALHRIILQNNLLFNGRIKLVDDPLGTKPLVVFFRQPERILVWHQMLWLATTFAGNFLFQPLHELHRLQVTTEPFIEESLDMIFEKRFQFS